MKKALLVLLILSLVPLSGCRLFGKKEETSFKSMEQIYQEKGVPVKTEEVRAEDFAMVLKYSATLRARSEAVRYSRISDVVQNVYFKVGDYVRENQTVLTFPENNQTTQYHQVKAAYELAATTYKRMERMYQEGVISKQELDSARTNFEVAKANLNTTDDSIRVKAPLSGYITQLNVKPTDNVNSGAPLFTVSNLDQIEAQIWASSKEIGQIKLGQTVTAEWNGRTYQGVISQVSQIMDTGKKAFEVKALFKNPNKELTSGITADLTIETERKNQTVVIDRKNLINESGKYFVYVVEQGKAVKREVEIVEGQGVRVEVLSGLKPGDLLITEGQNMVADDIKVQIVNS
ncbi:MAG TPA: efflux RND transporter periplasmic adaptor subunit [Bacillota bacterium]|jgi:membrane fusion protein (multidrug efflux system)|nr:efflux RND transporter periplasmic adaptor subunit [Bacillota bacterium]HOL10959.1 efflux RND transporter periplasmic adaptor subunit [Bacillota bacterium]HPO98714.1 efflux RND transporter periplasmic adaptor subunit [Bacillota bacterium]